MGRGEDISKKDVYDVGHSYTTKITTMAIASQEQRPYANRLEQIKAANEKYGYAIIHDMKAVLK